MASLIADRVIAAIDIQAELPELEDRLNTDADLMARVEAAIRVELGIDPKLTDPLPVPTFPDARLFDRPATEVPRGQKVEVGPAGEITGRFWTLGHCIIETGEGAEGPGGCWSPPPDLAGYNYFHQSDIDVSVSPDSVETVTYKAGLLVPGHAHPSSSVAATMAHYNDPTLARAAVRAYDDSQGGVVAGSMLPGSTYADAILVRASALSGHWEWMPRVLLPDGRVALNEWACLGPCLVGGPGLPLERGYSMTASHARTASMEPKRTRIVGNSSGAPADPAPTPPIQEAPVQGTGIDRALLDRITALESDVSQLPTLKQELEETRGDLEKFRARYYAELEIEAPELAKDSLDSD